jgi:hypothetical protein
MSRQQLSRDSLSGFGDSSRGAEGRTPDETTFPRRGLRARKRWYEAKAADMLMGRQMMDGRKALFCGGEPNADRADNVFPF